MNLPRRHVLAVLAGIAMLAAACSGTPDATPPPSNSATPSTTDDASPPASPEATEPSGTDAALGPDLSPPLEQPMPSTVFVLDVGSSVVLLARSGSPLGHLPDWTLDVERSLQVSAAVLNGPGEAIAIVTDGALRLLGGPTLELDGPDATTLLVADDGVLVRRFGEEVARLESAAPPHVSALRDRITVVSGDGTTVFTPSTGSSTTVPASCWVSDVHPDVSELLVCDDVDGRSVVTTVDIGVDDAAFSSDTDRAVWATVGTTGAEAMVVGRTACGGWGGWDVALEAPASTRISRDGTTSPAAMPLFWTAGGGRWVAFLGADCEAIDTEPGVYEQDADGAWTRLGAVYPALRAAVVAIG